MLSTMRASACSAAVERDRAEQLDIITVNIRSLTDLSLRFSDSVIRNRGGIINISSIAASCRGQAVAVYYASKTCAVVLGRCVGTGAVQRARHRGLPRPGADGFQARAGCARHDSAILQRFGRGCAAGHSA